MHVDSCFKIAYVVKAHGLKGELTLALLPECPDLSGLSPVFLEIKNQLVPQFIETASVKGTKAYVKFEGVDSLDSAHALKGCSLYLPIKHRPGLPKGQFYGDEVAGFEVVDATLGSLGTVKEVLETGASRHLVVLRDAREVLIPLNGPFIKSLNKSKKRILVDIPEGLLEL
jgi:16S rRNA processing protein RimM